MKMIIKRLFLVSLLFCLFSGGIVQGEKSDAKEDGIFATIETNRGDIVIKLYYKNTPLTVCNFIGLAEGTIENTHVGAGEPYFDGMKWHRVVDNWVIQTGCPYGTGSGDPGYSFQCEIDTPALMHDKAGIVGMANSGAGTATNGSQFYITHEQGDQYDRLNGGYTIFGQVIDDAGMDVVLDIRKDDDLEKITVERIGAEAEAFQTDQDAFDSLAIWITGNKHKKAIKKSRSPAQLHTRHDIIFCTFKQSGDFSIGIYTLNGRELYSEIQKKVSEGTSFAIPYTFKPGMYIATVKLGKNKFTHKIIMQ